MLLDDRDNHYEFALISSLGRNICSRNIPFSVLGLSLASVNVVMEVKPMGFLQTSTADTHSWERVVQTAEVQLRQNPCMCVRGLTCEYCAGLLVLRGRVSSYYHKQIAQETVKGIEGVDRVVNDTEVVASVL